LLYHWVGHFLKINILNFRHENILLKIIKVH
jgi:hypothetical protein